MVLNNERNAMLFLAVLPCTSHLSVAASSFPFLPLCAHPPPAWPGLPQGLAPGHPHFCFYWSVKENEKQRMLSDLAPAEADPMQMGFIVFAVTIAVS